MKAREMLRSLAKPAGVLLFTSTLAACGGSDSSSYYGLADGTFSKTVALNGTSTGTHNSFFNDSTATMDTRQYLFRAEDINGAGNITSLSFQHHTNEAADINCPDITITMAHIPSTNLDPVQSNNTANTSSSTETVLDGQVTIPAGSADAYFEVGLDTTFEYNGSDNLLVEYTRGAACSAQASIREAQGVSYDSGAHGATALNDLFHTKFNFEGGENRVVAGDQTSNNANNISATPGKTGRTQMLIRASDIDGEGPITGIRFDADTVTTESDITVTVKMAHVDSSTTSLGSDFSTNYSGESPTIVADSLEAVIPADASTFWLPLTSTFNYNGNDNILVDVTMDSNNNFTLEYYDVSGARVVSATTTTATTGSIFNNRSFQPTFRFNGADAIVANTLGGSSLLFDDIKETTYQSLYKSTEIGTAGKITKIACRLDDEPATGATDYPLKIVMGHASSSAITATFADNMVDAKTVFSGTFTLPAQKAYGDWAEIELDSAFKYNGEDDLIITYRAEPGANPHTCMAVSSATSRTAFAYSSTTLTSGSISAYMLSSKLEIRK